MANQIPLLFKVTNIAVVVKLCISGALKQHSVAYTCVGTETNEESFLVILKAILTYLIWS